MCTAMGSIIYLKTLFGFKVKPFNFALYLHDSECQLMLPITYAEAALT